MLKVKEERVLEWSSLTEYTVEIAGQEHKFKYYESSSEEPQYWFDEEPYWDLQDQPIMGWTVEDILSWLG
jgi:hypothetical protein